MTDGLIKLNTLARIHRGIHLTTGLFLTPITRDGRRLQTREMNDQELSFRNGAIHYVASWYCKGLVDIKDIELAVFRMPEGPDSLELSYYKVIGSAAIARDGWYTAIGDISFAPGQLDLPPGENSLTTRP